jgi:hypothetical protein
VLPACSDGFNSTGFLGCLLGMSEVVRCRAYRVCCTVLFTDTQLHGRGRTVDVAHVSAFYLPCDWPITSSAAHVAFRSQAAWEPGHSCNPAYSSRGLHTHHIMITDAIFPSFPPLLFCCKTVLQLQQALSCVLGGPSWVYKHCHERPSWPQCVA